MTARFSVEFINEAARDEYLSLDGSVRPLVDKGIQKLRLRADEIGKPLAGRLAGCRELKFRSAGVRLIYRIVGTRLEIVQIVAIGRRDKGEVFDDADRRLG